MKLLLHVSCLLLLPMFVLADPPSVDVPYGDTVAQREHKKTGAKFMGKPGLRNFGITGNYRGMIYYRNMNDLFDGTYSQEKMLLSTNDG